MNILVTGGAGFLGSHVVAGLARAGHKAVIYDVVPPGPEALKVLVEAGTNWKLAIGHTSDAARLFDVCGAELIDAIIHSAGLVGQELSLAQPLTTYQTNIMGTVNICEVARQKRIAKVVYISSNAVYHKAKGERLHETDAVFSISDGNPAAHYGASKMASEAIGLTFATFQEVDFLSVRITAIYGFGMRQPMYLKPMVEDAVRGRSTRFETGGPMRRDYTYVLDCVDALCQAVEIKTARRVLNVSSGVTYSAAEVASVVRRVIPGARIEIANRLNPLEAENVKMRAPLDIEAAMQTLHWKPKWSLEDGIGDYAQRYRKYISNN